MPSGDLGIRLEKIRCAVIGEDVITRDDEGQQIQGRVGKGFTINDPEFRSGDIPSDCPFRMEPTLRQLANFAVCNECPNSTLKTGFHFQISS